MPVPVIIFARYDSKRLPGKVFAKIDGREMLGAVIDRMESIAPGLIVVATTDRKVDDPIVRFCESRGTDFYRGSLENVVKRAVDCAETKGWDRFIRVTGDSPLMSCSLISELLDQHGDVEADLLTTAFPRTWPIGTTVEIIKVDALRRVLLAGVDGADLEHITRYMYAHDEDFKIVNYASDDPSQATLNISVDSEEDLERCRWIYCRLGDDVINAPLDNIVQLARQWNIEMGRPKDGNGKSV